jgi:hypothetical protein
MGAQTRDRTQNMSDQRAAECSRSGVNRDAAKTLNGGTKLARNNDGLV